MRGSSGMMRLGPKRDVSGVRNTARVTPRYVKHVTLANSITFRD